jgi:hypothetical protein
MSKRVKVSKGIVTKNERAATRAVLLAKKTMKGMLLPAMLPRLWVMDEKTRVSAQKFFATARMIQTDDGCYQSECFARVTVNMSVIPEVPDAVKMDGNFYIRVDTIPLTYRQRTTGEAERV